MLWLANGRGSDMTSLANLPVHRRFLHWLGDSFRRQFAVYLGLTAVLLVINELDIFGAQLARWDLLFISGVVTFVLVLRLPVEIPPKAHDTLTRFANPTPLESPY